MKYVFVACSLRVCVCIYVFVCKLNIKSENNEKKKKKASPGENQSTEPQHLYSFPQLDRVNCPTGLPNWKST